MRIHRVCIVFAASVVSACQTWGPTWSELSGAVYTATTPDRRPAILISVGTESIGSASRRIALRAAPTASCCNRRSITGSRAPRRR